MNGRPLLTEDERRHLVLLIDGTWVSASHKSSKERHSNIYKLNLFVETHSDLKEAQVTFYIPGVGSLSQIGSFKERFLAGVKGFGVDRLIEEAYINIVSNFIEADKLYIFGFSRGAVAARVVAELISEYGILKARHIGYYETMWEDFRSGKELAPEIEKELFHRGKHVEFLGLFDTVAGSHLYDAALQQRLAEKTILCKKIKTAVHLLALDETRDDFTPALFTDVALRDQYLEQIWMPGVHGDVGGGYVEDFLGKVSLLTMLDRLKQRTTLKLSRDTVDSLKESIKEDFKNDAVTVNDELEGWWRWLWSVRGVSARTPGGAHQFYHPVCRRLDGRFYRFKSNDKIEKFSLAKLPEDIGSSWISLFDEIDFS